MLKITFSMLFAVALPFTMVGCMASSPTESDSDPEDVQAEESVGEAESALTILDCCLNPLLSGCSNFIVSACPSGGGGTCTYYGYNHQISTLSCPTSPGGG